MGPQPGCGVSRASPLGLTVSCSHQEAVALVAGTVVFLFVDFEPHTLETVGFVGLMGWGHVVYLRQAAYGRGGGEVCFALPRLRHPPLLPIIS